MDHQAILAQLRPNHLPEAISYWPLAIGWWLLLASTISIISVMTYLFIIKRQKNKYRRLGLQLAKKIHKKFIEHGNKRQFAHDSNRLLKKVALQAFPRQNIANLNGKEWLDFLYQSSGNKQFKTMGAAAFGSSRFKPHQDPDVTQINPLTISWIKKHNA